MPGWTGLIHTPGLFSTSGNSGWLNVAESMGLGDRVIAIESALILQDPGTTHTGAETTDVDLNVAWSSTGDGDVKIHDFAQVTNTDVDEVLLLPGGESVANTGLWKEVATNADAIGALIPQWWKFTWVVDAATNRRTDWYACVLYEFR